MRPSNLLAVLAMAGAALASTSASAQVWAANHPRRAQANDRLATQNARIRQGVETGQLSHGQARQLHADDRAIRGEERADAAVNGGHITRGEQRRINRQENTNSRAIYGERRY